MHVALKTWGFISLGVAALKNLECTSEVGISPSITGHPKLSKTPKFQRVDLCHGRGLAREQWETAHDILTRARIVILVVAWLLQRSMSGLWTIGQLLGIYCLHYYGLVFDFMISSLFYATLYLLPSHNRRFM